MQESAKKKSGSEARPWFSLRYRFLYICTNAAQPDRLATEPSSAFPFCPLRPRVSGPHQPQLSRFRRAQITAKLLGSSVEPSTGPAVPWALCRPVQQLRCRRVCPMSQTVSRMLTATHGVISLELHQGCDLLQDVWVQVREECPRVF